MVGTRKAGCIGSHHRIIRRISLCNAVPTLLELYNTACLTALSFKSPLRISSTHQNQSPLTLLLHLSYQITNSQASNLCAQYSLHGSTQLLKGFISWYPLQYSLRTLSFVLFARKAPRLYRIQLLGSNAFRQSIAREVSQCLDGPGFLKCLILQTTAFHLLKLMSFFSTSSLLFLSL